MKEILQEWLIAIWSTTDQHQKPQILAKLKSMGVLSLTVVDFGTRKEKEYIFSLLTCHDGDWKPSLITYRIPSEVQRELECVETLQSKTERAHTFSGENVRIASDKIKRI